MRDETEIIPGRTGANKTLDGFIRHDIFLFQFFAAAAAAEKGNTVIEERSQSYCFLIPIGQYLHVRAVPVPVQNQVIDNEHLINVF